MTQISRPFQIALVAIVLLAALWFVVLRGHASSNESSGASASSSARPTAPQQASGAASGSAGTSSPSGQSSGSSSPSSTYHGSAPGVAGLTRAIAKARGAVAESQQNAHQLQQKSQQAENAGQAQSGQSQPAQTLTHSHPAAAAAPSTSAATKTQQNSAAKTHAGSAAGSDSQAQAKNGVPAMQRKVEGELAHGKVVAILFWNPKGAVDRTVRSELKTASRSFGGGMPVHVALAAEVGTFGTFTRAVQVYSTPTILLINGKGVTSSVIGLTDAFSIEQAAKEAKLAR